MHTTRWGVAITASLAMLVGALYICEHLASLNSTASWGIAGVAFTTALSVLGWWAAREPTPAIGAQESAPAMAAAAGAGERNQAISENNGSVVVSGDLNNSTIQVSSARTTSRRPVRPRGLPPIAPSIIADELPPLELGLRGRLMITGSRGRSHHISSSTRSAALDILNDDQLFCDGGVTALKALMDGWCQSSWHAEKWQLRGQASARESNARWRGRGPDGQRLTEARLNLDLAQNQAHGDSLTVTVHTLLANPFRPSPAESLELLFKKLDVNSGTPFRNSNIFPHYTAPPANRDLEPGPFLDLSSIFFLMFTILGTLWGPLTDELSTRIFSRPLGPPSQLDLAVFSVYAEDQGFPGKTRPPGINASIDFAPAHLIDGAAPRACTLLDPIEPGLNLLNCDDQDKVVHDWLSQLCLDNGYEDFEQELARISQLPENPQFTRPITFRDAST